MLIIALSGPDGTGKTSCARILSRILSRRGFNTKCVWIKHVHTVAYILVKLLEIINRKHVVRSHSGTFVTHSMASRLWGWIELIGIVPLVLKIYVSALISKYIENESTVFISDRYILDSLVHVIISLVVQRRGCPYAEIIYSLPFKVMRALLMRSTITILLDGDTDVLVNRKRDRRDPYSYLSLQRMLYKKLARELNIPALFIDTTNKQIHVVCGEIYEYISSSLA